MSATPSPVTTNAFNTTILPTTKHSNKTSEVSALAHKAIAYVTGSTTGIIVGVVVVIILIVVVVVLVKKAVSGLKQAKERAMSKLKDLQKSREAALDMAEAVPDVSVSKVQPVSGNIRKLKDLGEISFSIRYDDDKNDFIVRIHKATNLPLKYSGGVVYKYVEIEMFPYHRKSAIKPKTSYMRNALEPEWEEDVRIKMTREEVADQDMYLHVCDFNQISPRDLIGSYKVDFDDVKVKPGGKETEFQGSLKWIESIRGAERGDICLVLQYYREEGQLTVTVKQIRGLKPFIGRKTTSAYVKVHVVQGSKELDERRTKVKRKNFEPEYNETFKFNIPQNIIEEVNLIIRVKDSPYVGSKTLLGEVCVGGDAVGTYLHHWRLILEKGHEIEMWHALESLNIVPGKTNLSTVMKSIPVIESSESEEEGEEEDGGLLGFMPDIIPDIGLPSLGLFGSSDAEKEKKEKEEKVKQEKAMEKERRSSVEL